MKIVIICMKVIKVFLKERIVREKYFLKVNSERGELLIM